MDQSGLKKISKASLKTLTCSLGGKVEGFLWLTETEEVLREDLGLVLGGGAQLREERASLPRAPALGIRARLTRHRAHLTPCVHAAKNLI